MILRSHIAQLEKLTKALLYLMVLLCLPDTSGYASSSQDQAVGHIRTEIIFSHARPAGKTLSYQKAIAKFKESKSSAIDHQTGFTQLLWAHDRDFKVTFACISKQYSGHTTQSYSYQPKTIPLSSADLPPHPSRG